MNMRLCDLEITQLYRTFLADSGPRGFLEARSSAVEPPAFRQLT